MTTSHDGVDVLVVTALKLERLAVRAHLNDVRLDDRGGLGLDIGEFTTGSGADRQVRRVALLETGQGNVGAAVLATRAEEALRPGVVAMTGVAGGVKDVAIGDVVAGSKVYWIEGGKQGAAFTPRPDFAPVSGSLLQLARAVAAEGTWTQRATIHGGGAWPEAGRAPEAIVAPVVVGEKILAEQRSDLAQLVRSTYNDAVAVDMEDFGTLRGAAAAERTRVIAVRGISDQMSGKSAADAAGSQPLAAANAAAFVFQLLAVQAAQSAATSANVLEETIAAREITDIASRLYPTGPQHDAVWERAGGDAARLQHGVSGRSAWWHAATLLGHGGGGQKITTRSLVRTMVEDHPHNLLLANLARRAGA